jgi:predicted DsbA family dithiol-disulfide isomerase
VCPWCWIGDRRLFRAIDAIGASDPDVEIDVRWHAFQLDPTVPAEGRA